MTDAPETVHSDWGDWLAREFADADPAGVAVWYLGCNGFALSDGTDTLFVDPYLNTGSPPRTVRMIPVPFDPEDVAAASAVLATHEHSDHVDGPSQAPILANTGATFYGPDAAVSAALDDQYWPDRWDVPEEQFTQLSEGDTVDVGGFTVTVEAADDPDAAHPVSYVIDHDAGTFFHAGDARACEAFADVGDRYDIDLGAVAFGSVGMLPDEETGERSRTRWYNDENGIVEAANQLRLDRLLPTHWDMWRGMTADPTALHEHVASFEHPRALEVVQIGDRVPL